MAIPSKKSDSLEKDLIKMLSRDRREYITNNVCMWCTGSATEFKDELSVKEYSISGFCQTCQDDIFGED